jgi:hypothetical protein
VIVNLSRSNQLKRDVEIKIIFGVHMCCQDMRNRLDSNNHTHLHISRIISPQQRKLMVSYVCHIVKIVDNLHLASGTVIEAKESELCSKHTTNFVEVGGTARNELGVNTLHISVIYNFCEVLSTTVEEHLDEAIIICPERGNIESIKNVCFLFGAYLIIRRGLRIEAVLELFDDARHRWPRLPQVGPTICEVAQGDSVLDGWRTLQRARDLAWLSPVTDDTEISEIFDVEMSLHYAIEANGNIHTLVPGKLLFFPSPHSHPDNPFWIDIREPTQCIERRFSADYLADLLLDLDVSVVACLSECSSAHAAAFADHGLDVHDLRLDPRRPSMLRAMDRLLALTRAAPGAVAVFCGGDGGADSEWPAHVGTLAAAYLMSDFGFDAAAADAWLLMVCPLLCCGGAASLAGLEAGDGAAGVA